MAFMSLIFIGIAMIMVAVSVVCLILSLILFLVNRFRRKRGKEPKKLVRIAGIVFLVIGILNGAPILFLFIVSGVEAGVERIGQTIAEWKMPERAVYYDTHSDDLHLEYKDKKYVLLGLESDEEEKLKLSDAKAYVRSESEGVLTGAVLYELESEAYDLLYDDEDHLYCKADEADRFMEEFHTSSKYYMYNLGDESRREVKLKDLGLEEKDKSNLKQGPDPEKLYDIGVGHSLNLYEAGMDGKFRGLCTYLEGPDSEGNWYVRRDVGTLWWGDEEYELLDSVYLPEKGCRYMDSLMEDQE